MLSVPASLLGYRGAGEMATVIRNAFRPKPSLFVWQWADLRRKLNRKHSKEDGRWSTGRVPFMREPMECLSARSPVQRVVLKKGAQVSGTETANNWRGYTIDHDPSSILYVSPTLTVTKRTSARIQSMVDEDPDGLGRKILPARKAGSKNSQFEKHFPGGAIYVDTAMSAATLRSTAAGKVVLDEVDAYPLDVDGEGGVVEARGFTYGDQFKALLISTPGVEQTSVIEPEYKKGGQRFYFMRCPHAACGRHLHFRKEGFAWTPGRPKTVHYLCDHCGRKIVEGRHKTEMMAGGVWIPKALRESPEAMARIDAGDRSELDAFNAKSLFRSYHLPSFYSPVGWLAWSKIMLLWEQAERVAHKMKAVVNTIFGDT